MAPYTSPTKKARIVAWRNAGFTNGQIQEKIPLSKRQIGRIYAKYAEKENFYEVEPKSGRPPKLSDRDVRVATRHLANTSAHDATDLQQKFFPDVSTKTVIRALERAGLESHIRRPAPFISRPNLKKRRDWAEKHLHWTVKKWHRVLFSDESIFRVFGSDGLEWCWRRPGERLDPRFTKKRVKHGCGKVTVWGMITPDGPGRLVRIHGNMDKFLYRSILEDDLLGTFEDLEMDPRKFIFQHDNDPKHTAAVVKEWFQENHINVLPWAPSSADINIIEHVWDRLDRQVRSRNPLPQTEDQLWAALLEEWAKLDVEFIQKLYESLPRRVQAVVNAKGGNTRY